MSSAKSDQVPSGEALLERVIPFRFLDESRRRELATRLEQRRYDAGQLLVRRGENSREVFLLAAGSIEALDDHDPPQVSSRILAGHYVGERATLFDAPRRTTLRAAEPVIAYTLPGAEFLRLVEEVPTFAQALAHTLKIKQGVFVNYQRLYARILALIDKGEFLLSDLLPLYKELCPALHGGLSAAALDTAALSYAVARLPQEVTRTSFYFLSGDLPPLYQDPDEQFTPVHCKARRRASWQPIPGKLMVLLRDGISDITDLLTCLCAYAVEARKIRKRVSSFHNLRALTGLGDATPAERQAVLGRLGFSETEFAGLERIWGEQLAVRLREILLHHEDIALECAWSIDNYNSRASELWVAEIRERARELVDLEDPALEVHIISSNTHSVSNCLNPWLAAQREQILAWGAEHWPNLCGDGSEGDACWRDRSDLLYLIARHYLAQVEGAAEASAKAQAAAGQLHLSTTAFTGIEVDLFDARKLQAIDPAIPFAQPAAPTLIVNVDYAFGQQAEEILLNLLFEFGSAVRSVNVIGKAGGLTGRRGDVLLPRATLLQTNDELYPLPNLDVPRELVARLTDRDVHEGPVLTVAGTLLQDRVLLWFYRRIWKCVGLEMEGSFFARQLISAMETGVVRSDVKARFLYYVSDVPLDPDETLSEALAPWEGVPPLYAVTRTVLTRILAAD